MRQGAWKQRIKAPGKLWLNRWYWLKNMSTNYHHFVSRCSKNLHFFFFLARIVIHILNMVFNHVLALSLYQGDLLPLMLATSPSLYLFCQTLASSTCPINSTIVSVQRPCLRSGVLIFIQAGFHPSKWRVVTSVSASYQQQNVQFSSALALMLTWPQCLELEACIFDPLLTTAIPIVGLNVHVCRHFWFLWS